MAVNAMNTKTGQPSGHEEGRNVRRRQKRSQEKGGPPPFHRGGNNAPEPYKKGELSLKQSPEGGPGRLWDSPDMTGGVQKKKGKKKQKIGKAK